MRKLLLLLFLTAFIEADAQFFNARPAIEQWRDSVIHSVRLTPIAPLKSLSFSQVGNMSERSIMFQRQPNFKSPHQQVFQVGSFYVPRLSSIYDYRDYEYLNNNYSFGDFMFYDVFLGTIVGGIVENILIGNPKPKSKTSKKVIDY